MTITKTQNGSELTVALEGRLDTVTSPDLEAELKQYRMTGVFDEIIHLQREAQKADYVTEKQAIFIDDSYGERRAVAQRCGIPVFDTHMIECLLEGEV